MLRFLQKGGKTSYMYVTRVQGILDPVAIVCQDSYIEVGHSPLIFILIFIAFQL